MIVARQQERENQVLDGSNVRAARAGRPPAVCPGLHGE